MTLIAAICLALGVALVLACIRVIQGTLPPPTSYTGEPGKRTPPGAGIRGATMGNVWLRRFVGIAGLCLGFILCFIGGGALIRELIAPVAG